MTTIITHPVSEAHHEKAAGVKPPASRDNTSKSNDLLSDAVASLNWGRMGRANTLTNTVSTFMILWCPVWVTMNWMSLEYFDGSLPALIKALLTTDDFFSMIWQYFPQPSWTASLAYASWLALQALLYYALPGKMSFGQRTPGGCRHQYEINGAMAWAMTHLLFAVAVLQGWLDPACIAKNWAGLFVAANVYGYLLAVVVYVKGLCAPTNVEDRKFSGSWAYDFWMGLELNPRIGSHFDIKLFHNGRPGIVAWSLIDISFAAWQYERFGSVSNSMLIVIVLHTVYALDFFFNEAWYLETMDITHDHMGMMLAWGDAVFLPSFYTIQAQYLAYHPVQLSNPVFVALLALGLGAYAAFRASNSQKVQVREANGDTLVWGRPATTIRCDYRTADGKEHQSLLLTCGWWSIARHANYTVDLVMAWAMCAPCSGDGMVLLPWTYFIFQFVFLNHRIIRGEESCRNKYGDKWEEYCKIVPWRLIPGIY